MACWCGEGAGGALLKTSVPASEELDGGVGPDARKTVADILSDQRLPEVDMWQV